MFVWIDTADGCADTIVGWWAAVECAAMGLRMHVCVSGYERGPPSMRRGRGERMAAAMDACRIRMGLACCIGLCVESILCCLSGWLGVFDVVYAGACLAEEILFCLALRDDWDVFGVPLMGHLCEERDEWESSRFVVPWDVADFICLRRMNDAQHIPAKRRDSYRSGCVELERRWEGCIAVDRRHVWLKESVKVEVLLRAEVC